MVDDAFKLTIDIIYPRNKVKQYSVVDRPQSHKSDEKDEKDAKEGKDSKENKDSKEKMDNLINTENTGNIKDKEITAREARIKERNSRHENRDLSANARLNNVDN